MACRHVPTVYLWQMTKGHITIWMWPPYLVPEVGGKCERNYVQNVQKSEASLWKNPSSHHKSIRRSLIVSSAVRSLGWEDPLEEEMAMHSSIPAWEIPWTEEPGGLQSVGSPRVGHDWATSRSRSRSCSNICHPSGINLQLQLQIWGQIQ